MVNVELTKKIQVKDFVGLVDDGVIQEIMDLGEELKGISMTHVNSTATGGGVAEILQNLVPLMRDVGLDAQWEIIKGSFDFFTITKKIHNALQGMNIQLTKEEEDSYIEYNRVNSQFTKLDADIVMVHDAQPASLIQFFPEKKNKWIWRCHVDLSTLNLAVWSFLEQFINKYDSAIFTAKQYVVPSLAVPIISIMPPAINPLNDKNRELTDSEIAEILQRFDIKPDKPIITQVGRFDPWKDPTGAVDVYRIVKKQFPGAQLLLIAGMATDDPEGWLYLEKTARHAGEDRDIHLLTDLKGVRDLEVNAFQRASQVVLQLSTREGFGLTVSEALWKRVPVVARRVGGIPLQIVDESNGFLVNTVEQAAEKTLSLLKDREKAKQMGINGREYVKNNFLIIGQLRDNLKLFSNLLESCPKNAKNA